MAIGTGALAVSANAFLNLVGHARAGNVRWLTAVVFATAGLIGAFIGSTVGDVRTGKPEGNEGEA